MAESIRDNKTKCTSLLQPVTLAIRLIPNDDQEYEDQNVEVKEEYILPDEPPNDIPSIDSCLQNSEQLQMMSEIPIENYSNNIIETAATSIPIHLEIVEKRFAPELEELMSSERRKYYLEAERIRQKKYRERNRDSEKERHREYRQRKKNLQILKNLQFPSQKYGQDKPRARTDAKERHKKYREKNRDMEKQRHKEYRQRKRGPHVVAEQQTDACDAEGISTDAPSLNESQNVANEPQQNLQILNCTNVIVFQIPADP